MNQAEQPLFLVSIHFDARKLYVEGKARRLPLRDIDLGYLLHCHLTDLFGELAPKPFTIAAEKGSDVHILGYSNAAAETLRDQAHRFASPEKFAGCDWERLGTKPVPVAWHANHRVGFSVRACPTQRMAGDGPTWKKGAEVDVFLAHCQKVGAEVPVDRENVYLSWLERQFETLGGAKLEAARLVGFKRERLFRRTDAASGRRVERPTGLFEGELVVSEPMKFQALLRRGVGRHRAFGFGMILLRPARVAGVPSC